MNGRDGEGRGGGEGILCVWLVMMDVFFSFNLRVFLEYHVKLTNLTTFLNLSKIGK